MFHPQSVCLYHLFYFILLLEDCLFFRVGEKREWRVTKVLSDPTLVWRLSVLLLFFCERAGWFFVFLVFKMSISDCPLHQVSTDGEITHLAGAPSDCDCKVLRHSYLTSTAENNKECHFQSSMSSFNILTSHLDSLYLLQLFCPWAHQQVHDK